MNFLFLRRHISPILDVQEIEAGCYIPSQNDCADDGIKKNVIIDHVDLVELEKVIDGLNVGKLPAQSQFDDKVEGDHK